MTHSRVRRQHWLIAARQEHCTACRRWSIQKGERERANDPVRLNLNCALSTLAAEIVKSNACAADRVQRYRLAGLVRSAGS